MKSLPRFIFVFVLILSLNVSIVEAQEQTVSATVGGDVTPTPTPTPVSNLTNPNLHSPADGSYTTNATSQPFSWQRSTSSFGINHYTFYRDGIIFADDITEDSSQNTSIYTATVDSGYVYLTFKARISEGPHTWKVIVTDNAGFTASSETWNFVVDTTTPLIILQTVDKIHMYWATHDPSTIPPWEERQLISTTADPLLSGKVEAISNIKFSLVCPVTATSCTSQSITVLETDGNWEHRFRGLIKDVVYSVFITATDVAGNVNSFPEFTITYQAPSLPFFPTPTQAPILPPVSPEVTLIPSLSPSLSPIPFPLPIPPTDFFRLPPPPPLVPNLPTTPTIIFTPRLPSYLYTLIIFGLLLHLLMTFFGTSVKLPHLPGFLFNLTFPFFGKKPYFTEPNFVTVTIFDPLKLDKEYSSWISDVRGKIQLDLPSLNQIFIRLTRPGYLDEKVLTSPTLVTTQTPLKLKPKDRQKALERFRTISLGSRSVPLMIADITSFIVLIFQPSLPVALYLSYALLLSYSEYLYPRLSK